MTSSSFPWKKNQTPEAARLDLFASYRLRHGLSPLGERPWREIARPEQLRPPDCTHWLYLAGRGAGKTRSAAERIAERVRSGEAKYITLIGPTLDEARAVMLEGESGLLSVARDRIEKFNRSDGEIWFRGGARARVFSGEDPDSLRGWQSTDVWGDELCAWRRAQETFDMAMFGLRLGEPEAIWTTTPRSVEVLRSLMKDPSCVVTRSSTYANRENLSPTFFNSVVRKYEGTNLGRQELDAEILDEVQGALWQREWFDREGFRLPIALTQQGYEPPPGLVKVVVGIDPSISDPERLSGRMREPDACGMVVAGCDAQGNGYVLADYTEVMSPLRWSHLAVKLADKYRANLIVAEANQGGEMIRESIQSRASNMPVQLVHASAAKRPRAEPLAVLYEQGRVRHCGEFRDLEDQMTTWDAADPGARSPNNVDALVWAFHGLGLCNVTGVKVHDRFRRAA